MIRDLATFKPSKEDKKIMKRLVSYNKILEKNKKKRHKILGNKTVDEYNDYFWKTFNKYIPKTNLK